MSQGFEETKNQVVQALNDPDLEQFAFSGLLNADDHIHTVNIRGQTGTLAPYMIERSYADMLLQLSRQTDTDLDEVAAHLVRRARQLQLERA